MAICDQTWDVSPDRGSHHLGVPSGLCFVVVFFFVVVVLSGCWCFFVVLSFLSQKLRFALRRVVL